MLPGDGHPAARRRRPAHGLEQRQPPAGSALFAGVEHERFYFVHSYAASDGPGRAHDDTEHGEPFVAAVEHGALSATQFHPEKSGSAGLALLRNWLQHPGDPEHLETP